MPLTPVRLMPDRRTVQLDLFELVPGQKVSVPRVPLAKIPRVGIIKWTPSEDGIHFRPEIETHPIVVSLKRWDEQVYGCTRYQIACLVAAGFVDGERLSPRHLNVVLESFFIFRERVRENPWFWQDSENHARYITAMRRIEKQWKLKVPAETDPDSPELPEIPKAPETASGASAAPSAPETPRAPENAPRHHGGRRKKAPRP
jgi:hypothetical protein